MGQAVINQTTKRHTLGLRYAERRWLLVMPDILIVNLAMLVTAVMIFSHATGMLKDLPRFTVGAIWSAVLSIIWLITGQLFDIFDTRKATNPLRSAWSAGMATLIACFIFTLTPGVSPALPSRRLYLYVFPFVATGGIVLWRLLYGTFFVQAFTRLALIVGTGDSARALLNALPRVGNELIEGDFAGVGYQIVGIVDPSSTAEYTTVEGIPIVGTSEELPDLVNQLQPDELILAVQDHDLIQSDIVDVIINCRELGVDVTTMLTLFESVTGRIPVTHVGSNIHRVLPLERPVSHRAYLLIKRLIDFIFALFGTMFLALVIPFVWLGNRLTDPGDLFYLQERIGEGGRPYNVIKFRSMVMDAEKFSGAVWAEEDDPRITPVGRFLRKSRLDEVPQFWNMLRGDMSLIGPRPERPHFVEQLAEEIPFYRARHAIKPGLTGWAQVNYGYGATVDDSRMKLEYDLYYIKNQSLYLDLQTIVKTVQVVVGLKGR